MRFDQIARLILQDLDKFHKGFIKPYAQKLPKDFDFGPMFKAERTWFSIQSVSSRVPPPKEVEDALEGSQWKIDDWSGTLAKNKTTGRQLRISKVFNLLLKNDPERLKAMMGLLMNDPSRQGSKQFREKMWICITHNPYDVGGMSTRKKHWTSCMHLPDNPNQEQWRATSLPDEVWDPKGGSHYQTALNQIEFGGMCAYLVPDSEKQALQTDPDTTRTFEQAFARIAIKRFVDVDDESKFIYVSQNTVYGSEGFAQQIKFADRVNEILSRSNQMTCSHSSAGEKRYTMFTNGAQRENLDLWSDNQIDDYQIKGEFKTQSQLLALSQEEFVQTLAFNSKQIMKYFIQDQYNEVVPSVATLSRDFKKIIKNPLDLMMKYAQIHPSFLSSSYFIQLLGRYFQYLHQSLQTRKLLSQMKKIIEWEHFKDIPKKKIKQQVRLACIDLLQRQQDLKIAKPFIVWLYKIGVLTELQIFGGPGIPRTYALNYWFLHKEDKFTEEDFK